MPSLTIALIIGSTRKGRFADKPVQWIQELASKRQDFKLVVLDLRDFPMPFFDEAGPPVAVPPTNEVAQRWGQTLSRFDGFIFVTPEYNHGPAAVLKNALDYAFKEWNLKPAAFVGYGAVGAARAVQVLRLTAATLRMVSVSKAVHIGMIEFQGIRGGKPFTDFPYLEQAATAMFDELASLAPVLRAARPAA